MTIHGRGFPIQPHISAAVASVGTTLAIDDLTSIGTLDNLALTQVHQLAIDNLTSITTLDNVAFKPPYPVPTSISSSNRLVDQDGNRYIMKGLSSWGFAQRASNAQITDQLTRFKARGFNVINFAFCGGIHPQNSPGDWAGEEYFNAANAPFFATTPGGSTSSTPFQSSLGAAFATTDWIIAECARLEMTAMLSLFISYAGTGVGADIDAATNAQMRTFGAAVGARYNAAPNIVWEIECDDGWASSSTRAQRIDYFARGIGEGRTAYPNLFFAEPYANASDGCMGAFLNVEGTSPSNYQWLHLDANGLYWYGNDCVDAVDIAYGDAVGYGTRKIAVWDSEPGYAQATQYASGAGGNQPAGVRQRLYSNFIRGYSGMNWGHERWWCCDLTGLFPGATPASWLDVVDATETIQAQYGWSLLDSYVKDSTWAPVSTFITSGQGTTDHEVAQGAASTTALAYFPSSTTNGSTARTIVADTTIIAGTANVRVRWYDPTAGTFSSVATSEAQNASRSVSIPAAHGDGSRDFVLVVDLAPTDLVIADLTSAATLDAVTLTQVHQLAVGNLSSIGTLDNLALTQVHQLAIDSLSSIGTLDNLVLAPAITLVTADLTSAATLDALTLTQVHQLAVADLMSIGTLDNLALTQVHQLAVADLTSVTTLDNVVLTLVPTLAIADLTSAATLDGLALTQVHQLSIDGLASVTVLDPIVLTGGASLTISDLTSAATLDALTLTQVHQLSVAGLVSVTTLDPLVLAVTSDLVIADLTSAAVLDPLTLGVGGIQLVVADLTSVATLDALTLTQAHVLTVQSLASLTFLTDVTFPASEIIGSISGQWVIPTVTGEWVV